MNENHLHAMQMSVKFGYTELNKYVTYFSELK